MENKDRIGRILTRDLIILVSGMVYIIFMRVTGIIVPCVFKTVTGLYCPGCGITRMFKSLISFDFKKAIEYNPFLLLTAPYLIYIVVRRDYLYVKTGQCRFNRYENISLVIYLIFLIVYGVIRNVC